MYVMLMRPFEGVYVVKTFASLENVADHINSQFQVEFRKLALLFQAYSPANLVL
jgi:hypothetical protein